MGLSRRCDHILATDAKWYLILGYDEHDYDDEDCTNYGPFDSYQDTEDFLKHFPSTSGSETLNDGTHPVPENLVDPKSIRR